MSDPQACQEITFLAIEPEEARDFLWWLLDAHSDAILLARPDGTIAFANEAAARSLGQPCDHLLGVFLWDVYPEDKANHRRIIFGQVVKTALPAHFIDRYGNEWYETVVQPLVLTGRVTKVIVRARNITCQIEAEERLKRAKLQLVTTQEDERRRIAQDLHDDIGQRMTALLLCLKATQGAVMSDPGSTPHETSDQIKDAIRMAEGVTKQVRQILYQLRPPMLANVPLPKVLEELVGSFAQSSGLRVDWSSDPQLPPIPEPQGLALYRCVQEGLNNVRKHAGATSVWVNLDCVSGEVSVSLEDDGCGFDVEDAGRLGLGLQGIRDRFLMLDGNFTVESSPGSGTRLFGSLPLTGRAAEIVP